MSHSASLSVSAWDGLSVKSSTPSSIGALHSFLFVGWVGGGGVVHIFKMIAYFQSCILISTINNNKRESVPEPVPFTVINCIFMMSFADRGT